MSANRTSVGYIIQLSGVAAFTLGAIFSVHHIAVGALFIGGAVSFYVGEKVRTLS
jgi:hypothetical protein